MKRVRLLIYDYQDMTPDQIEEHMAQEVTRRGPWNLGHMSIKSIELNPMKITIMEIIRLFLREGKH